MDPYLSISLIHPDVHYKDPSHNRDQLFRMNAKAARQGADLILNTELSISGYSFLSLDDVADYTETVDGETVNALTSIAVRHETYICIGFAEKDLETGIFYNTALVIGPDGSKVCRYRKVNAEARWACPGNARQNNTFDTPWGCVGVLICSDTYQGLMTRQTALRGADMILVPANWPAAGLDPREFWRARALENGIYMVACNRGGKDRTMVCNDTWSCAYGPEGEEIFARTSFTSEIYSFKIPLTNGRMDRGTKKRILDQRKPRLYRPIYLDMRHVTYNGGDYTTYYELPPPDTIHIMAYTGTGDVFSSAIELCDTVRRDRVPGFQLYLFPCLAKAEAFENYRPHLEALAQTEDIAISIGVTDHAGKETQRLIGPDGRTFTHESRHNPSGETPSCRFPHILDMGPLRIGICGADELRHPETAVSYAKLGCDLIAASTRTLTQADLLVLGIKSVEQSAIAVAGRNTAFICEPPVGHARWKESWIRAPGACSASFDTRITRQKRFQDRIDFNVLLSRNR